MIVSISDFRNIKKLEALAIDDGRINFLTGISGTGKTAIAQAIVGEADDLDSRAGSDNLPIIKCNPTPDAVDVFNDKTVDDLYVDSQSSTAFSVVMLKSSSYKQAENMYYESIRTLQQYEAAIRKQHALYSTVIEQTKAKYKNNGALTATCSPAKAEQAVSASSPERTKLVKERGGEYLSWLHGGTQMEEWVSDEKRCPFCLEPMKEARVDYINLVASDNGKGIAKVTDLSEALSANGINCGDLFNSANIHEALLWLESANQAKEAYARLIGLIEFATRGIRHHYSLRESDYAESSFFKEVPGLESALAQLAESDRELRRAFGVLHSEFEKSIASNTEKINEYLRRFDIPYRFELGDLGDNDKASYSLVHTNCNESIDYKAKLSYGERNIISLLLFLLKPRSENELVIIDDPVSSYDEFRRAQIFRMIFELDVPNTVLLMSHDHVFAKYALFFRDKAVSKKRAGLSMSHFEVACSKRTGRITYLENTGGLLTVCDLEEEDYGLLQEHIKNRLRSPSLTIRQKVINLRMYMETIPHADGIGHAVYGYLSALLHYRQDNDINAQVEDFFARCEFDELEALAWIKENTGVDFPQVASIEPHEFENNTNLCQFERLIALRESVDDLSLKDELNDMVHLNAALVYCLNPYSYSPCSNKARRLLASWVEGSVS